jgi:hypothetical protein
VGRPTLSDPEITVIAAKPISPPMYRCLECDADWSYEAVRHTACCAACGGGLVRLTDREVAKLLGHPRLKAA